MPHYTPLIATIVAGIVLAFIAGAVAHRLKASPLVGYLLAGVVVGPFTPGYLADVALAQELAEIGVILLMFGVGLHFSFKELLSVRAIAARARDDGVEVIAGNAADAQVVAAANLEQAQRLFVAIPNAFEAGQIVAQAREANPVLPIIARAHADAEVAHLMRNGANQVIMGEREIARGMLEQAAPIASARNEPATTAIMPATFSAHGAPSQPGSQAAAT
jgi:voltage-gated potassium channel Kch